ncbi:MAG TPA: twin-arginine translocase TatA/TatE family subunit [Terriglobales bacterium]|jgi:sec-independent protein translocase protein TatA|nr:twin-arginine translocase TatA/TatE family subunit [Terriglobales bacterium]
MEALSIPHLLIILVIVLIFFGGRRIPDVMRGLGEGIRSFKEGMHGDQHTTQPVNPPAPPAATAPPPTPTDDKK